jgi:DNA polymerase-3 subunit epsilon
VTFPDDHWARRPVLVLDTETTGIDPETALVASVSAGLMDLGNPDACKPVTNWIAVEMPAEASAVNHLTTEFLAEKGSPAGDVLADVAELVALELAAGTPLVIANAPYDLTVLDRECRRNGVATVSERLHVSPDPSARVERRLGPVLDPIVLDKRLVKFRRRVSPTQGARQLKTLCQVHGVGWDDELAHTSEYDARQAGAVLRALLVRFPLLRDMTLPGLHDAQVRWYAEQAVGLRGWFEGEAVKREQLSAQAHRVGDGEAVGRHDAEAIEWREKARSVDTAWPIRAWSPPPALAAEDAAWVAGATDDLQDVGGVMTDGGLTEPVCADDDCGCSGKAHP